MPVLLPLSYTNLRKTYTNQTHRICIESMVDMFTLLSHMSSTLRNVTTSYTDTTIQDQMAKLASSTSTISFLKDSYNSLFIENTSYLDVEQDVGNTLLPHFKSSSFLLTELITTLSLFLVDMNVSTPEAGWYLYSIEQWDILLDMFSTFNTFFGEVLIRSMGTARIFDRQPDTSPLYLFAHSNVAFIRQMLLSIHSLMNMIRVIRSNLSSQLPCTTLQLTAIQKYWQSILLWMTMFRNNHIALFQNTTHSHLLKPSNSEKLNYLLSTDNTFLPVIYADAKPPIPNPTLDGWDYQNNVSGKINWYFTVNTDAMGATLDPTFVFGSVQSIYYIIEFRSITSTPFLALYSVSNGVSWYGNKKVYSIYTPSPSLNKRILVYQGVDPRTLPISLGAFDDVCVLSFDSTGGTTTFKSNKGDTDMPSSDKVLFLSFHTDSSASVNNVNFTLFEFGYYRDDITEKTSVISRTISNPLPSLLSA